MTEEVKEELVEEVVSAEESAPQGDVVEAVQENAIEVDEASQEDVTNEDDQDETSAEDTPVQVSAPDVDWYIIQCFTGHEYKVQARLHHVVEQEQLQEKVLRILVPEEETIEIKNNKRVEKTTKIYPGYVFVQMKYDEPTYFRLRNIAGVVQFVGSKLGPTPVTEDEILRVLRKVGDKSRKIDVDFEVNEAIKVISGPFRGYTGPISEINAEKGTLKALLSVFGRETPVKLDFDQVESAAES